jgi:hypothetical protein
MTFPHSAEEHSYEHPERTTNSTPGCPDGGLECQLRFSGFTGKAVLYYPALTLNSWLESGTVLATGRPL